MQEHVVEYNLKCKHCDEIFANDENLIARYTVHQNARHKDKMASEEKIFEDFREKMIKQKDDYEKSKEKMGDSDLVFNAKERDLHN